MKSAKKLFEDLKIVEVGMAIAGPIISSYFTNFGAETIRIESSQKIDPVRTSPPYADGIPGVNRSVSFANINAGKMSFLLNLKHEKGKKIFLDLARRADIVIDNLRAGTLSRLGLGYSELQTHNKALIVLSTTTQGQTGRNAHKAAGFGLHVESICGFVNITGWKDRAPSLAGGIQTDYISGKFAILSLASALYYRQNTGIGQYIDISHVESSLHFLSPAVLAYSANNTIQEREGNSSPVAAPHNVYPCKGDDKWISISIFTDNDWLNLCRLMDMQDLVRDENFKSFKQRKRNEKKLDSIISQWTCQYEQNELFNTLQSKNICSSKILDGKQTYDDPQLRFRNHWHMVHHNEIGDHNVDLPGFRISGLQFDIVNSAPSLGAHNAYICTEILNMSDEEFIELELEGVFT